MQSVVVCAILVFLALFHCSVAEDRLDIAIPQTKLVVRKAHEPLTIAVVTVPTSGHHNPLVQLMKRAAEKGHRVLYMTPEIGRKYFNGDRLSDYGVEFVSLGDFPEPPTPRDLAERVKQGIFSSLLFAFKMFSEHEDFMLENLLAACKEQKPDVLFSDFLTFAGYDASDMLDIPLVVHWPGPYIHMESAGLASPQIASGLSPPEISSPVGRLKSIAFNLAGHILWRYAAYHSGEVRAKHGLPRLSLFSIQDILWMRRVTVVNSFVGFDYVNRLPGGQVTYVGPMMDMSFNPDYGEDLSTWLAKSSEPVVYVAFGTVASPDEHEMQQIAEAIRSTKGRGYRVLWAIRDAVRDAFPTVFAGVEQWGNTEQLKVMGWTPQASLLMDERITLFVTHGGYNSMCDAMRSGTPLVCTPFFGDQPENCARASYFGFSETLLKREKREMVAAIEKVLNDSHYREKAAIIQDMFISQSNGSLDRALSILEEVARYGDEHLLPGKLEFYQQYNIDIIAFFAATIAFWMFILSRVCRCLCGGKHKETTRKAKKE